MLDKLIISNIHRQLDFNADYDEVADMLEGGAPTYGDGTPTWGDETLADLSLSCNVQPTGNALVLL